MTSEFDTPRTSASDRKDRLTGLERLEEYLTLYPHLSDRIMRQMLVLLHERGALHIDDVYSEARDIAGSAHGAAPTDSDNHNVADFPRGDQTERDSVQSITRRFVGTSLSANEVDNVVNLTLKREEADKLRAIVSLGSVSFRLLADTVRRFCALPVGELQLAPDEAMGIRVGLIRHLVSDQLEFIAIAKRFLRIRDFEGIINRTIGAESGMGRVGGKAAGMYLAATIIGGRRHHATKPGQDLLPAEPTEEYQPSADPAAKYPVAIPESYYMRSDVIEDFLAFNGLGEYQNQKYRLPEEIQNEYRLIKSVFRNADFPAGIVEQLREMLAKVGDAPLIVRSSSLLEDRLGTAFSGKYASLFVANQGTIEQRIQALLGAVAEVYASVLGPDPLMYRRAHDLLDYEEDMAVLIQKVIGTRCGPYFAPVFAGVAFSRNEYRWSPRIKREDGLVRLVMGLGTRAVDRIAGESPRLVALGVPTLRHESTTTEIMCNSQRTLDVINVEKNKLESVTVQEMMKHGGAMPLLDRCLSIRKERLLVPPMGTYIDADPRDMYITFDKLLSEGIFTEQIRYILRKLEKAYGFPVDVEFAHDGETLYILQCRTLSEGKAFSPQEIPVDVEHDRIVFSANKLVRSGRLDEIEYIVFVPPRDYDNLESRDERVEVARAVGRVNNALGERRFILIGPGRWGSNDLRLGVPVTYADINNARMLIEVAVEKGGYVPEVSFGTHFFQDLVEANILYLPLYPDADGTIFNEKIMLESENHLSQFLPNPTKAASTIRVIHLPSIAPWLSPMQILMNGDTDKAIAFFPN